MQTRIRRHFGRLALLPVSTQVTRLGGKTLPLGDGFTKAMQMLKKSHTTRIIGNGGSAAIASHMAEDYTKNGNMPMMAFNDAPMLTCFANDLGYENIFSAAIEYYASPKDLVIAISSSGKSPNIINGVLAAKKKGCNIITLSGFKPDNQLRQLGDINFYVPSDSYGNVEITHLSILHCALDLMCEDKSKGAGK